VTSGQTEPICVGLSNVTQGYRQKIVLTDTNISLRPGITALLGSNGAGKTTLMRTLVTELPPKSGYVVIDGAPVSSRRSRVSARTKIGYLPQGFEFDRRFRVNEYVEYLAWLRGFPKQGRSEAVASALHSVGLADKSRERMTSLSGGMRQRVGIAGAVVGEPSLLVLDEPTVGLDPAQRVAFRHLIKSLRTPYVLLSTHLTEDVDAIADHVVVLDDGEVLFDDHIDSLRTDHGSVEEGYLGIVGS